MTNPYQLGLNKNGANYTPLSPLSFMRWTASVYPSRIAVIHGNKHYSWSETYARCRRLASALKQRAIGSGDTVAVMLPNIPAMYEAHFGVAMAHAVLNTLNTRLDAEAIAFMLEHGEAKLLITDREFAPIIAKALGIMAKPPLVIDVDDSDYFAGKRLTAKDLEEEQNYQKISCSAKWTTRPFFGKATRTSRGLGPRTSGTRFRSTTPQARLAIRRVSFTITVERI